ncbi:4'-phosphopantetheinyl transferase superfamily protein [Xanthomonas campestris pv. campestris]|nr:4'-phosphopantetheinyl transferase superfamily protein [Xanthomonas campestris pv. campestris]
MACENLLPIHHQEQIRVLLLQHEREREALFRFALDRQSFLLTRALVRKALSAYTGVAPSDLRFQITGHGKPELVQSLPDAERIFFNVSHARGLIAIVVTRKGRVGVDVEKICARSNWLELAEHFFAPNEVACMRLVTASELPTMFFSLWTLKESYLKARGVGLSVPLDNFAFCWSRAKGVIAFQAPPGDDASTWKFWQLSNGSHLLSICAEQVAGTSRQLLVRCVTPEWQCTETHMNLLADSRFE